MSSTIRLAAILILAVLLRAQGTAQNPERIPELSDQTMISLMTCGPGTELYSMFGHSALWVFDPVNRIDRVYNYGTFDFDDEAFYYKFIRGIADYKLSVSSSHAFMQEYMNENRTIEMQELELTREQKQALFLAVEENYLPENRYYRYDFFFLNCSSIIRDRVFEVTDPGYTLDSTDYNQSFRDLLQPYIQSEWITLGINFLLGHRADIPATNWHRMFLPDHMHDQFGLTRLRSGQLLAPESQTIFLSTAPPTRYNESAFDTPMIIFAILFLLTGLLTRKKHDLRKWNQPFDALLFLTSGLAGSLLLFMWLFSEHAVTHENIHMLWAFPAHLFLPPIIRIKGWHLVARWYARTMLASSILFMVLAVSGFQDVPLALIFLCGTLILRLFRLAFLPQVVHQVQGQ